MRKQLFIMSCVTTMALISSCGRSYSCHCSYRDSAGKMQTYSEDMKGSKNHALHECCTIRKAKLETEGAKEVLCAVPI